MRSLLLSLIVFVPLAALAGDLAARTDSLLASLYRPGLPGAAIGIVKNGNSSVRYGETTLRVTTSDQPFQFSFIAYLPDVSAGDYFEIYYSNASSNGKVVKIQDIQWYANTQ